MYTSAPVSSKPSEGKSFSSGDGPLMSAAPVSAPISWDEEPTLYTFEEPVPTLYYEEPVPTLYEEMPPYGEDMDWEVSPMEDYMRGPPLGPDGEEWEKQPKTMDYDVMPIMEEYMPDMEYEIMPIMEEYIPEDMNWDDLSDPDFYYN